MIKNLNALINLLNENYPTEKLDYEDIQDIAEKFECTYGSGCTRFALVYSNENYVFKMPRFARTTKDFCKLEVENLETSKRFGIAEILLPERLVGKTSSGLPIYQQIKYDYDTATFCFEEKYHNERMFFENIYEEHEKIIWALKQKLYDSFVSTTWLAAVYHFYGEEFLERLVEWTKFSKVNDLHNHNTGFLNGKPVILDYAGYEEKYDVSDY